MTLGIYSIRDHLTGFMTPVIEQNDAAALRNFQLAIERYPHEQGRSVMSFRPSDFDFFRIGDFHTETGLIDPLVPPQLIASGLSVKPVKEDSDDAV